MKFSLQLLALIITFSGFTQSKELYVISNDGNEMNGHYEMVKKRDYFSDGVLLIDSIGNKIEIQPNTFSMFQIGNTIFKSISDKNGKKRFMEEIVKGSKASLYSYTYPFSVNIPGEGLSSGTRLDYYMKRGKVFFNVRVKDVMRRPEKYFPGNEKLSNKIKNTKKSRPEIVFWTLVYNGQLDIKELPK